MNLVVLWVIISLVPRLSAHFTPESLVVFLIRFKSYMQLRVGRTAQKTVALLYLLCDDSVSVLSLWHKRAPKSSYKKSGFAAFLCRLKTAAVLAHAKKLPFYPSVTHVRKSTKPIATASY